MKRVVTVVAGLLLLTGLVFCQGCTVTPGIDLGINFDYYGGQFHVRPNASIGVHGRP